MTPERFAVGQELWIRDVNERRINGPTRGVVTKVGRTLVTVEDNYGHAKAYRKDTGRANDNYGHQWLQTDEERAEEDTRAAALTALAEIGLRPDRGSVGIPTDLLTRLAAVAAGSGVSG